MLIIRPPMIHRVVRDESGSTSMIFALALLTLAGLLGVAVDFGRASSAKSVLQRSTDSAAIAAVQAAASGGTAEAATQAATELFASNSKSSIGRSKSAASCTPSVHLQTAYDISTATVSCSECVQTTFLSITGMQCLSLAATSTAQAYSSQIVNVGFNGTGWTWGDPHVYQANGNDIYLNGCNTGSWYNLLSDSGIEVNVTCQPWGGSGPTVITEFSLVLGSHVFTMTYPNNALQSVGWGVWAGYDPIFTVDGVVQDGVPSSPTPYLDGQVTYGTQYVGDRMKGINQNMAAMAVNTPQYQLVMAFTYGGFVQITASGSGRCGTPGGFWGQSLAGYTDYDAGGEIKAADYKVSGPSAT